MSLPPRRGRGGRDRRLGLLRPRRAHHGARRSDTPWGVVPLQLGEVDGGPVAFLARHGAGHTMPPAPRGLPGQPLGAPRDRGALAWWRPSPAGPWSRRGGPGPWWCPTSSSTAPGDGSTRSTTPSRTVPPTPPSPTRTTTPCAAPPRPRRPVRGEPRRGRRHGRGDRRAPVRHPGRVPVVPQHGRRPHQHDPVPRVGPGPRAGPGLRRHRAGHRPRRWCRGAGRTSLRSPRRPCSRSSPATSPGSGPSCWPPRRAWWRREAPP